MQNQLALSAVKELIELAFLTQYNYLSCWYDLRGEYFRGAREISQNILLKSSAPVKDHLDTISAVYTR